MIGFAKPVLTEDLCVVQKEEFFNNMLYAIVRVKCTLDERPSIFVRDSPIFSSETVLHKDYDRKGSVEKISDRESQGT
jgi:hypothetical protein